MQHVKFMQIGGVTAATVEEAMSWLKTCDRPDKKAG